MRNLPAVLFLALVACGSNPPEQPLPVDSQPPDTQPADTQPPPPDSQVLDTSCMANQTPPTTATPTVTASGAANSLDISLAGGTPSPQFTPLPDADVVVCIGNCQGNNNQLDTTTSSAAPCDQTGCAFTTAAIDTPNDQPINAYLKVSKDTTLRTTNIFPSEPIRADLMNVPALVMTTGAFDLLAQFLGGGQTVGNGAAFVVVTDCALTPAQGATLTVKQGNTDVGTIVDAGAFSDMLAGTFIVFDIPPDTTTIAATVNGTVFRSHDIEVFANETSATQVTPGFAAP